MRRAGHVASAVVAVVSLALPFIGALTDVGGAMEEGFMLVFPERVLAGDVPNRDFLHLYGPGSLWVLAAAFALLRPALIVERGIGALQLLGVVLAVRSWLAPWGFAAATTGAVIAAVFAITPIGLVALPWMGGLALLLWGALLAVRALEDQRPRLALAGGVLAGFALLYRPDLAGALLAVALVAARRMARAGLLRPAVLGGALGTAPMLVHVAMAGFGRVVDGIFVDPVVRLRPGRALPVPPSSDTLDGYLQRIAELVVLDWPAPFTIPVQLRTWFLAVVVATVVIVVGAVVATRRGDPRHQRFAVIAAIAAGILPQALQRPDSTHLAWVSCFTLAVLPIAIAELVPRQAPRPVAVGAGLVAVALAFVALFPAFTLRPYTELVLQSAGTKRTAVEVTHGDRNFFVGRADVARAVEQIAPLVDADTAPGDRLFVGPADLTRTPYVDTWLYHLFPDLEPATYYLEMDPGIADAEGSRLADDLASADAVLLTTTWDNWVEPNDSVERGDDAAAAVLRDHFCVVDSRDGVTYLRRCR